MAHVTVDGNELVVELSKLEAAGALHRSPRVPLTHVESVETSSRLWSQLRGMRLPGTGFPGVIALGTWRFRGGRDFAAVYRGQGVVVTLKGSDWERLLVSCSDPQQVCERINRAR